MELGGIRVDVPKLLELEKEYESELIEWQEAIFSIAGEQFNIHSNPDLKRIFYTKFNHPKLRKSKTGPSLDEGVLLRLSEWGYELAYFVIGYRKLFKLITSFIRKFKYSVARDGKLHCSFSQTGTETGRFSCKNPNLQQIPPAIRECLIADEGKVLLSADYKQMELRVLAHLSQEPWLVKTFQENKDPHQEVALEFGVSRDIAKTINFGIIYGVTDYGLSQQAGISLSEAADYLEKWFEKSPKVKEYSNGLYRNIILHKEKQVETMFGRTRRINGRALWEEFRKPSKEVYKQKLWRLGINTAVQGSSADIVKLAMQKVFYKARELGADLILQVHDELVFSVKEDSLPVVALFIKETLENVVQLSVPLPVDIKVGQNWKDLYPQG